PPPPAPHRARRQPRARGGRLLRVRKGPRREPPPAQCKPRSSTPDSRRCGTGHAAPPRPTELRHTSTNEELLMFPKEFSFGRAADVYLIKTPCLAKRFQLVLSKAAAFAVLPSRWPTGKHHAEARRPPQLLRRLRISSERANVVRFGPEGGQIAHVANVGFVPIASQRIAANSTAIRSPLTSNQPARFAETCRGGTASRDRASPWLRPVCRSRAGSRGISMLQQTPLDANARSTEPPNSCGMRSRMMLTPYLQSGEAATAGPPTSRHAIDRFAAFSPGPWFQFTSTRPCGVDSAPYFAAFVTNSCSTIASTWVAST